MQSKNKHNENLQNNRKMQCKILLKWKNKYEMEEKWKVLHYIYVHKHMYQYMYDTYVYREKWGISPAKTLGQLAM